MLHETLLVGNELRSVRTAMDELGTQDPEAELARVVGDRTAFVAETGLRIEPPLTR